MKNTIAILTFLMAMVGFNAFATECAGDPSCVEAEGIRTSPAEPCTLSIANGDIGKGRSLSISDIEMLKSKGYKIEAVNTLPFVDGDVILSTGSYLDQVSKSRKFVVGFAHVSKMPNGGDALRVEDFGVGSTIGEAISKIPACQ
jgi:hypothetical protein